MQVPSLAQGPEAQMSAWHWNTFLPPAAWFPTIGLRGTMTACCCPLLALTVMSKMHPSKPR